MTLVDDLDDFIYEVKYHIASEIESLIEDRIISPYIDEQTQSTRPIDLLRDIKVIRSQVNRTEFRFTYSFYAKYAAKRLWGEYIIDKAIR